MSNQLTRYPYGGPRQPDSYKLQRSGLAPVYRFERAVRAIPSELPSAYYQVMSDSQSSRGGPDQRVHSWRQYQIDRDNFLAMGAALRNGPRTVEDADAIAMLSRPPPPSQAEEEEEAECPTKWMYICDPSMSDISAVEVMLDECTDVNWITQHLVDKYHLETEEIAVPLTHYVVTGHMFTSSRLARADCMGQENQTATGEFYVLPPASPVDRIILGKMSINEWKAGLFDDNPAQPKPMLWTGQKKKTPQEVAHIEAARSRAAVEFEETRKKKTVWQQKQGERKRNVWSTPRTKK